MQPEPTPMICDDCDEEVNRLTCDEGGRSRCDKCQDRWESGPQNDDWLSRYYGGGSMSVNERCDYERERKRRMERP